jgi:hypothetical protein
MPMGKLANVPISADARQAMAHVAVIRSCRTISLHASESGSPTQIAALPVAFAGGVHTHGPPMHLCGESPPPNPKKQHFSKYITGISNDCRIHRYNIGL